MEKKKSEICLNHGRKETHNVLTIKKGLKKTIFYVPVWKAKRQKIEHNA